MCTVTHTHTHAHTHTHTHTHTLVVYHYAARTHRLLAAQKAQALCTSPDTRHKDKPLNCCAKGTLYLTRHTLHGSRGRDLAVLMCITL